MSGRSYEGRVAIVTGASRGIGLAIAEDIVGRGGRVCLTARSADDLEETVARLGSGSAIGVVGNIQDDDHRRDAVTSTLAAFGSIDILVNNAATNVQYGPLVEADLAAVEKVLRVNVVSALGWVQAVWQHWMRDHGGAILNVASIGAFRPSPPIGAYAVSKAALVHLTQQLALELAPGVRVNAVAPAVVRTGFSRILYEGKEEEVASGYPLGRLGRPDDVAHAARCLLEPEAGWITGQTLVIDGGVLLTHGPA